MRLRIEPITPAIGARILNSAADCVAPRMPAAILEALDLYNLLAFPEVAMDDETFLALTAALGEMHDNRAADDGFDASQKAIFRITLDKVDRSPRQFIQGYDFWHIDGTPYPVLVKATLLKCESAAREGGDTGFTNLHAAFAALPAERRADFAKLKVGHCLSAALRRLCDEPTPEDFARWDDIFPRLEHPLVWHQQNGRPSLLIGSTAHDNAGFNDSEGRALLDELLVWSTQERFTYRHTWKAGDRVIFNNPRLLHRSYRYDDAAGRVMYRTTLKGREPTCAAPARKEAHIY